MSERAEIDRTMRRLWAASGSRHDRVVRILRYGLPLVIGVVAAVLVFSPFTQRGEISFLLDRNKVAIAEDRLRVDNAMYRGIDNRGRPFSLTAGHAVQRSSAEGVVRMEDLKARILLAEGPGVISAGNGRYDIRSDVVNVDGPVSFTASDGYRMIARDVAIDLGTRKLTGQGKVEGTIPSGTFSADHISADLGERTVALYGNARLQMIPGKLRMPQ